MSTVGKRKNVHIYLPTPESKLSFAQSVGSHNHLFETAKELDSSEIWSFVGLTGFDLKKTKFNECSGTDRFFWPAKKDGLILLGLFSATTLGGLVVWDLLHSMPEGATLYIVDFPDVLEKCPVKRAYFEGCLEIGSNSEPHLLEVRKVAKLPVEKEAGMDEWSFLVPVGKPNPDNLIEIRERIQSQGFKKLEFMVCCAQEHEHLLPEGWSLVPQPEANTSLTRKKNVLVDAAKYPNVCVFHDRVIIPKNFRDMVHQFGDFFPITGLQNIYINSSDFEVSRYSDYYIETSLQSAFLGTIAEVQEETSRRQTEGVLYSKYLKIRQGWKSSFVEALPTNYTEQSYLTGSIYTSKKSVWQMVQQNESIDWMQLEDVEFGIVAMRDFGIPSRINPFGFARTNRTRPILTELQYAHDKESVHQTRRRASARIGFNPSDSAEPAFPISDSEYKEQLSGFISRWVPDIYRFEARQALFNLDPHSARSLAYTLIRILYLCQVRRIEPILREFILDFGVSALMTPYDDASMDFIVKYIQDGAFLIDEVIKNDYMMKFVYLASRRPLFSRSAALTDERIVEAAWRKWKDPESGIVFGGDFAGFVHALKSSI